MRKHNLFQIAGLFLASILLLAYNDDPPDGRTGAPFNGRCSDCHTSNNPGGFNGVGELVGLPDTIQPNTTYSLQLRATVTAGNPVRAGFQLVVVDQNNNNAGNLTPANNESGTDFLSGREYLEHRGGKYFGGMPVSWSFNWTAPAGASCNAVKFYYIVNFCNGSGDFGDHSVAFSNSRPIAGEPALSVSAITLSPVSCPGGHDGAATVQTNAGTPPYQYLWSTGSTGQLINGLTAGTYAVTVMDNAACTSSGQTTVISLPDTISPWIECPPALYVCAGDTFYYPAPVALDNCILAGGQPELVSGLPSGSVFPAGSMQQVFLAADETGNTATCSFTVLASPAPTASIDTVIHDMNNTGTGSIAVTVGAGAGPFRYVWKKDGLILSTMTEDLTGLHSGAYALEVVDSNGCSVLLGPIAVSNTVGTHEATASSTLFRLEPNPSPAYFRVVSQSGLPVRIHLLHPDGKVLRVWNAGASSDLLSIAGAPAGLYFVKIETDTGGIVVLRLVKSE